MAWSLLEKIVTYYLYHFITLLARNVSCSCYSLANFESVHNESHYPVDMESSDRHDDDEGELLGGHPGGDPDGGAGRPLHHISQVSGTRTGSSSDSRGLSEIL